MNISILPATPSDQFNPPPCNHSLTFAGFPVRLQGEPYGAAAAHPSGRIFTCPVTATIVDSAGLCRYWDRDEKIKKGRKGKLTFDPLHGKRDDKDTRNTEGDVAWDKALCCTGTLNQIMIQERLQYIVGFLFSFVSTDIKCLNATATFTGKGMYV